MRQLCLFLGVLEHIDVLRDACCIPAVGENLRCEVKIVERVEPAAMKLEIIHEHLGGNVSGDGLGMPELEDPRVLDGVDDGGVTAAFGGFMKLKVVPQKFVESLGAGADNGSGVVRNDQVDDRLCGRGKHLVVAQFVGSIRG